jgi:hypothetical protein
LSTPDGRPPESGQDPIDEVEACTVDEYNGESTLQALPACLQAEKNLLAPDSGQEIINRRRCMRSTIFLEITLSLLVEVS